MRTVTMLACVFLLAACGADDKPASTRTSTPAAEAELTTRWPVTVIDDGRGAELCLGMVATSLPPQCEGQRLVGWDWPEHAGEFERRGHTRWGEFVITGTFDGEAMTPTEVVAAADLKTEPSYAEEMPDFSTPCPEPEGGWIVDASHAGEEDQQRAFRVASRLDDYGSSYIDTPHGVVNIRVTGDLAAAEKAVREVWGGGLCVRGATHTDAELARIQRELTDAVPHPLGASRGEDEVTVLVVHDDGSLQRSVDERYGEGMVVVESALVPVDGS